MIRATTPTQIFKFPVDPSQFSVILITYSQLDHIVLEKGKDDLEFGPEEEGKFKASFNLTQEETKLFRKLEPVFVQVRVLTTDGVAMASKRHSVNVYDVLDDEILTNAD